MFFSLQVDATLCLLHKFLKGLQHVALTIASHYNNLVFDALPKIMHLIFQTAAAL